MEYSLHALDVRQTEHFSHWLSGLNDGRARSLIENRIYRLRLGQFGDASPVGGGVIELRIHFGPGYRIYLTREANAIVLLLAGGDKSTQRRDIARAIRLCQLAKRGLT